MRIAEMIGKENSKKIESALRRFVPILASGGKEWEALSAEEWEWVGAVSDVLAWLDGTEYERLTYLRYVRRRKNGWKVYPPPLKVEGRRVPDRAPCSPYAANRA